MNLNPTDHNFRPDKFWPGYFVCLTTGNVCDLAETQRIIRTRLCAAEAKAANLAPALSREEVKEKMRGRFEEMRKEAAA